VIKKFPFFKQFDQMDCGPSCLRMIARYHGKHFDRNYLSEKTGLTREGVSVAGIIEGAEAMSMKALPVKVSFESLKKDVPLPCIAHWKQRHFVIVFRVSNKFVWVADPAFGKIKYTHEDFIAGWSYGSNTTSYDGLLVLLEPTNDFFDKQDQVDAKSPIRFLAPYFRRHKRTLGQLAIGLFIGSLIQLLIPFITQAVVDYGITYNRLDFIYIMLIAQLTLFFSQTAVILLRDWLLLHLSTRINIALISDFLFKIIKLPISFFDSKMTGDLLQRVQDHRRIESFLSNNTLTVIFSVFSLVVFGVVLLYYHIVIFLLYAIGTVLYIVWVLIFMKQRARLDYLSFDQASLNQNSLIQLIQGMQEIKLNNSDRRRRIEWESIQLKLYQISQKGLKLMQYQRNGGVIISELKNILITFYAAKSVIDGSLTLGTMLAIQYIIGQLNNPIRLFIAFIQSYQDAKLSLARVADIHINKDEDFDVLRSKYVPNKPDTISINDLYFKYGVEKSPWVIENVSFTIQPGQKVAIVGSSGSGKTTLIKLLLKFYPLNKGKIEINNNSLTSINAQDWRKRSGVVMQDGFIFNDSIIRNITESDSDHQLDRQKLELALYVSNLSEFVNSLPANLETKIGSDGIGLSGGQKQRILIARAVYKDPTYLFFDEATSALDANNEKIVMNRLEEFYKDKSVIIVAHRLSTVKNADKILVLEKGRIVEQGTHKELTSLKNHYYKLVKNQLELGE